MLDDPIISKDFERMFKSVIKKNMERKSEEDTSLISDEFQKIIEIKSQSLIKLCDMPLYLDKKELAPLSTIELLMVFYVLIENKQIKDRQRKMRNILECGIEINKPYGRMRLLEMAIMHEDLLGIKLLLEYGAEVNFIKQISGVSLLHSLEYRNLENKMTKYIAKLLLDHSIDVNSKCSINSISVTPLAMAVLFGNYECAKLFLEYGADPFIKLDKYGSLLSQVIGSYSSGKRNKINEIIELLVERTGMGLIEFCKLCEVIETKKFKYTGELRSLIDLLVEKTPKILEMTNMQGNNLLLAAAHSNNVELFVFLKDKYYNSKVESLVNNNNCNCFLLFALTLNNDMITKLAQEYPNMIHSRCSIGKTAIDYSMEPHYIRKHSDNIIKTIKLLIKLGVDLNNCNKIGFRTIEYAIYCDMPPIVEFLIESTNIEYKTEVIHDIKSTLLNRDILSYACLMGNYSIVQILLDHDPRIISDEKTDIPIAILHALISRNWKIVCQILDIIKLNPSAKDILFKSVLQHGCFYKPLLEKLEDKAIIDKINFTKISKVYEKINIENLLKHNITSYAQNKKIALRCIYVCTHLMVVLGSDNLKNIQQMFNGLADVMSVLTDTKYHDIYDEIFEETIKVIKLWLEDFEFSEVQRCIYKLLNMVNKYGIVAEKMKEDKDNKGLISFVKLNVNQKKKLQAINFVNLQKEISKFSLDKIDALRNYIHAMLLDDDLAAIIDQPTVNGHRDKEFDVLQSIDVLKIKHEERKIKELRDDIEIKLKQLVIPYLVDHYYYLWECLEDKNFNVDNTNQNIIAFDDLTNNIKINVWSIGDNKASTWFKYYGRNISKEGKQDILHMFSFKIDSYLKQANCIERIFEDNKLLYFPATITFEDERKIYGCLEFFSNRREILYHRFFNELKYLPDFMKYTIHQSKIWY